MASSTQNVDPNQGWRLVVMASCLFIGASGSGFSVQLMNGSITFPYIAPRQAVMYSSGKEQIANKYCNYTNPYKLNLTRAGSRTYCIEETEYGTIMSPPFTIAHLQVITGIINKEVPIGHYVQIKCPIAGARGQDIRWTLDGQLMEYNRPGIYVDLFGNVHIYRFNKDDEGSYICRVNGTEDNIKHTTVLRLAKHGENTNTWNNSSQPIRFNLTANRTLRYVARGSNVQLWCPMNSTIYGVVHWVFNERSVKTDADDYFIANFSESNEGEYSCGNYPGVSPFIMTLRLDKSNQSREDNLPPSSSEYIGTYETETPSIGLLSIRSTRMTVLTDRAPDTNSLMDTTASMARIIDTTSLSTIDSGCVTPTILSYGSVDPFETTTTPNMMTTASATLDYHRIYKRFAEYGTFPDEIEETDHYIHNSPSTKGIGIGERSSQYDNHHEGVQIETSYFTKSLSLTSSPIHAISKIPMLTDMETTGFLSASPVVLESSFTGSNVRATNYFYHNSMDITSTSKRLIDIIASHTVQVERVPPDTRMSTLKPSPIFVEINSNSVISNTEINPNSVISNTASRESNKVARERNGGHTERINTAPPMKTTGTKTTQIRILTEGITTEAAFYRTTPASLFNNQTHALVSTEYVIVSNHSNSIFKSEQLIITTAHRHLPNGSVILECVCSNEESTIKWHGDVGIEWTRLNNHRIELRHYQGNFEKLNFSCSCHGKIKRVNLSNADMTVKSSLKVMVFKESHDVNDKIIRSLINSYSPSSHKFMFLNGYFKESHIKSKMISSKQTACLQCDVTENFGRFFDQLCFVKVELDHVTKWPSVQLVEHVDQLRFNAVVRVWPPVALTFSWKSPVRIYDNRIYDEQLKQYNYSWEIKHGNSFDTLNGKYICTISTPFEDISWQLETKIVVSPNLDSDYTTIVVIAVGVTVILFVFFGCLLWRKYSWLKKTWYDRKVKRMAVKEFKEIGMSITKMRDRYVTVPSSNEGFPRQRLRLLEVLGEGNFGKVVKAEALDISGNGVWETVAIKMCKETATDMQKEDFAHELSLVKTIPKHPNVVSYLGYCQSTDQPTFMILEYISGGNLLYFLRKRRPDNKKCDDNIQLDSSDLSSFAHQIAKGLEHLSSNNIIHRDVAARNILISEQNVCKVADLGLARELHESDCYEISSKGVLPIRWMAPESLTDGVFTQKSDVWSFGVLLWEIVTLGASPYPGMAARQVMSAVVGGQKLECPDFCSNDLKCLIMQCWEFKADNRPDFTEICRTLEILLEEQKDYLNLSNYDEGIYEALFPTTDDEK